MIAQSMAATDWAIMADHSAPARQGFDGGDSPDAGRVDFLAKEESPILRDEDLLLDLLEGALQSRHDGSLYSGARCLRSHRDTSSGVAVT
ncbi:MAG: hypothetical protein DMG07_09065 [Acidobacteria bacterium]|nr:MAG: hypothetical protein DMG07_09065 [Acidobacteriota bacterium]